ncbi:hypothetical protein Pcinc_039315 [Petrolisthes cinctipes]|uniref:Uncharacterized protein n=1 Tax=Petrolisthes cinctipes TaxID=88211 RepID=A0AAE1BRH8_PETCI|nr:hypothetical protein Pcinc_039315 [Petrolisthes cinctipes]
MLEEELHNSRLEGYVTQVLEEEGSLSPGLWSLVAASVVVASQPRHAPIALVCVIFLPLLVIFCVCYLGFIQFMRHKPIVGTAERRQRTKKRKVQ